MTQRLLTADGRTIELEPNRVYSIGRGSEADIQLAARTVSRLHCRLEVRSNSTLLTDAESRSGTVVSGHKIRDPYVLADEDVIEIGEVRLVFRNGSSDDASDFDFDGGETINMLANSQERPIKPPSADRPIPDAPPRLATRDHGATGPRADERPVRSAPALPGERRVGNPPAPRSPSGPPDAASKPPAPRSASGPPPRSVPTGPPPGQPQRPQQTPPAPPLAGKPPGPGPKQTVPVETLAGLSIRPASLKDLAGKSMDRYELKSVISAGVSGYVYLARDPKFDRPAAVKVMSPEFTRDQVQEKRFIRAMKTMIDVRHENIVEIFNAGKQGPFCWTAMQYVDGPSLTDVARDFGVDGMLGWRETFRIAVHVGRALSEAYRLKIVHRNVTPQNILLRRSDRVALLSDLVLAKALESEPSDEISLCGSVDVNLAFSPPERLNDGDIDCRSDIYGLGATLYSLLTGRPPLQGRTDGETVRMILTDEPPKPREFQRSLPDSLQAVVLRMLAKVPSDRFQSPWDLLGALDRVGKENGLDADE